MAKPSEKRLKIFVLLRVAINLNLYFGISSCQQTTHKNKIQKKNAFTYAKSIISSKKFHCINFNDAKAQKASKTKSNEKRKLFFYNSFDLIFL